MMLKNKFFFIKMLTLSLLGIGVINLQTYGATKHQQRQKKQHPSEHKEATQKKSLSEITPPTPQIANNTIQIEPQQETISAQEPALQPAPENKETIYHKILKKLSSVQTQTIIGASSGGLLTALLVYAACKKMLNKKNKDTEDTKISDNTHDDNLASSINISEADATNILNNLNQQDLDLLLIPDNADFDNEINIQNNQPTTVHPKKKYKHKRSYKAQKKWIFLGM